MPETEADTCRKLVTPKIYAAGWTDEQISEQKTFTDGRIIVVGNRIRRRKQKRADYLLRLTRDFPIAIVEAKASEHLARMVAMRNAAAATDDIVSGLTLTYNKWRQADITAELLDITGGAEALRQDPSAGVR